MSFEFVGDPYAAQLRAAKAEGELAAIMDALREFAEENGLNPEMEPRELLDKASGAFRSRAAISDMRYDEIRRLKEEIEAMRPRLMPEGMEWLVEAWPRFEDGEPVRLGDRVSVTVHDDHGDRESEFDVDCMTFYGNGARIGGGNRSVKLLQGERVKRPAPKAFDADGVEIRVGDTVWHVETGEQCKVVEADSRSVSVDFRVDGDGTKHTGSILPTNLTHRAPVLAADGKPLREGETVWSANTGEKLEVVGFDGDYVKCRYDGMAAGIPEHGLWHAHELTHERPESWERIEEDAGCTATEYNERRGTTFTTKQQVARDLVRRAKKLAGVSE